MKKVLALVIVVLLLTAMAAPMALAADGVTIVPNATYQGETVTMTANGVDELVTVFDLASIGFGSGIEYGFWFENSGSFSFDRDVTLIFQGQPKFELKAGETYNIADDGYSECYLQLDDGNMIAILDKANPGNWASLTPSTPWSEVPATINGVAGAASPSGGAPSGGPGGGGGFGGGAPGGAPAPGIESGAPITVYVSVSANGVCEIASQPVEITTYSVEAALIAAHEKYYSGGASGFHAGTDNSYAMYMIDNCWGVPTTPYVILNTAPLGSGANSAYISADTAPVAAGDNIIVVADAAGLTPAVSMEYDAETQIVKLNQWALDFTTFQYTSAAVEEADVIDAETGAVLGTTNALGNARLSKQPTSGVVMYQGVGAVRTRDDIGTFTSVKDKYVAPAHDYSVFGGKDGRSLRNIVLIGVGLIIPLLIVVIFAYRKETQMRGIKYEDLRGDNEVTRHL